ncbi:hypothetical protein E4K10_30365 [Streptomyces sp. T1317-0309]|nr:hypothetical protein E4K10_30365 [Streptomyces sp. T1317-0309]
MDAAAIAASFTAAGTATHWTSTRLGLTTQVDEGGYTYCIRLPKGSGKAFIASRDAYGGGEHLDIEATWTQTMTIVDAAMAATRIH